MGHEWATKAKDAPPTEPPQPPAGKEKARKCGPFESGETRTRTGDTTIFSRVLYQLSYLAETGEPSGESGLESA